VEGVFTGVKDEGMEAFLLEHELDLQEEVVVRREIAPNGKSRAFINDTPVNLSQLDGLSSLLVDLHQQFDTLELGESDFQRDVLDALSGNFPALKVFTLLYTQVQQVKQQLTRLKEEKTIFTKEFDYHQFQYNELEEAGFRENELEDLDAELKLQSNAEGIKTALVKTYADLQEKDDPIVRQLKSMINSLQPFAAMHTGIPALTARLQSAYIELQDVAEETERISNSINADAEAIERISERLSLGYRLMKKHGVKETGDLLQIKSALSEKLQAVLNIDGAIEQAQKDFELLLAKAEENASKISAARKAQIKPLESHVAKMLVQVGMPNAVLKVEMQPASLNPTGSDRIEFLFDANRSGHFQPLRKVASGGELSRLMLCIKSLVARSMNMPTLIFDEIDTGISGEAAKQVGAIMKELSASRQVISITHQPQIAGKADAHFFVYKTVTGNTISTSVRQLSTDERIVAIAKMLSGEKPTAAALENAREMVMN
ncbi:MAG: DNA repair protein RecN, partial [Chitinophagaceae bacterium]